MSGTTPSKSTPVHPSSGGIKNLGRALTNIKKDVAYDIQHGKNLKSKAELEKEKIEKQNRLKEALHDREDADNTIKGLIDDVVQLRNTVAGLQETVLARDSKIDELSHQLEKEISEKEKEIKTKQEVEAELELEKQKLKDEIQAKEEIIALKDKEIEARSQAEKELAEEREKTANLIQALEHEKQEKEREIEEKLRIDEERARELALREELEGYLIQAKENIDELQAQVDTITQDLNMEKEAWDQLAMEKRDTERINENLVSQMRQVEAEKQAVQLELGNTATLLEETNIQRLKLEEALAKEKTKSQERGAELQRVEAEAARFKEEWDKESKAKADLEAKLSEETERREELEHEASMLREEVEEFRNDRNEDSIQKLKENAMILEERLQLAQETLEEERDQKSAEIKEVMERAIHQRQGIEEQLQKEKQLVARLEADAERLREELKTEIERRESGEVESETDLHSSNNQLKLQALDAGQKINKLTHERDSLASQAKQANESLTRMTDKYTKLRAEFEEAEKRYEEEKKKNSERYLGFEQELKEVTKALEKEKKEGVARIQDLEKEKKRAERLEQDLAKLRTEWELQGKTTSSETISKLREDNARLEAELEKYEESSNVKEQPEERILPATENGGDVEYWQKKAASLQAALDLTTKNNVKLQKQVVFTEDQHIKLMEQIKAFTTEMDESMTVKQQQAKKIKQLQSEVDALQKQVKDKITISKPNIGKFFQHLSEI